MAFLPFNVAGRIFFETIEDTSDLPYLVFLHEGLGCQAMWKDFPARLCRLTGCPGLIYDRLGYGKSSPDTASRTIHYLHEYALIELPYLIERIIPNRPYILIGHSDGGTISLIHGAGRPAHLLGIISEAAHVFVEPATTAGIRETNAAYAEGRMDGLSRYHGEKTEQVFSSWSDTWLSDWFQSWNVEYLLPSIVCPLMVIQGADDGYATDNQVRTIANGVSGFVETVLMDDCGHSPHREQPEMTLTVMSRFIEQVLSRLF